MTLLLWINSKKKPEVFVYIIITQHLQVSILNLICILWLIWNLVDFLCWTIWKFKRSLPIVSLSTDFSYTVFHAVVLLVILTSYALTEMYSYPESLKKLSENVWKWLVTMTWRNWQNIRLYKIVLLHTWRKYCFMRLEDAANTAQYFNTKYWMRLLQYGKLNWTCKHL